MSSPLEVVLSLAAKASSTSEAVSHLREVLKLLNSEFTVTRLVLKLLNKLSHQYDYQLLKFLVKVYAKLCELDSYSDANLVISLANDVYTLCEYIKGTDMSDTLEEAVTGLLAWASEHFPIEKEQYSTIQGLIEKKNSLNFPEMLKPVIEDLNDNNPYAISRLMDIFSSMASLKEQYFYFSHYMADVISAVSASSENEIKLKTLSMLEHFLFQVNFNIKISSYDKTGSLYSNLYVADEAKFITKFEGFVHTVLGFLNLLLEFPLQVLRLLERLWHLFPSYSYLANDLILKCLTEVASLNSNTSKGTAASFLYKFMHSSQTLSEFKGQLESSPELECLFVHDKYQQSFDLFEAEKPIDLDTLNPLIGFPMTRSISPGEVVYQIIEVNEPNCILCWGFATEYYDISYSITRVDIPQPHTIISEERINSSERPVSGIRLLHSAGLYRLEWNNFYSWFRFKNLRFRLAVLRPFKSTHSRLQSQRSNIIEISDQSPPFKKSTEVGIVFSSSSVSVVGKSGVHIFPDLSSEAISCIESLGEPPRMIGVLSSADTDLSMLNGIGKVARTRDVEALALHYQNNFHPHSIAVVISGRSSVLHRGRFLLSESGNPLCDISQLTTDPTEHISKLMTLFKPSLLVSDTRVENCTHFKAFEEDALLEAALKLHDLLHKFKFAL